MPARNRPNGVIDVLSGVVDTDAFATPVNFPFVVTAGDGVHVLPKGTTIGAGHPVPQGRGGGPRGVRAETDREPDERIRTRPSITAGGGWYRRHRQETR